MPRPSALRTHVDMQRTGQSPLTLRPAHLDVPRLLSDLAGAGEQILLCKCRGTGVGEKDDVGNGRGMFSRFSEVLCIFSVRSIRGSRTPGLGVLLSTGDGVQVHTT